MNELVLRLVSVRSKRISDLLVGVHHDSDGGAEGARWEVLSERGAHLAALSVRRGDLTPDALVIDASLLVLGFVDESNALAMVGHRSLAVLASLDGDKSGVLFLSSLTSLETGEKTLRVKSTFAEDSKVSDQLRIKAQIDKKAYLTGSDVFLEFDFVSMSTFNLIFM